MKKLLLALSLCSLTAAEAQTNHPAGISGCIARYDFTGPDSTLPDVSGNGHPATAVVNLQTAGGFRGRVGQAKRFDGQGAHARANPSAQFNLNAVTIVALLKFNGFYSGNCQGNAIVNRCNNYYTTGTWGMDVSDQGYDGSCSIFSPGFGQMSYIASAPTSFSLPSGNYLSQNEWYLLVSTYDGTTANVYQTRMDPVNKQSAIAPYATYAVGVPIGTNVDSLYIGRLSHPQFPYWLNADVDEIAIFDKALTASDVYSMYSYLWGAGLGVAGNSVLDNATVALTDNVLRVRNPVPGKAMQAIVYDMTGRTLARREVRGEASIELGSVAAGLLMVRLECDGATVTKKVSNL